MESWNDMTTRHTKEQIELKDKHEFERYKLKLKDTPGMMDEYALEQRIKQENNEIIARHYNEAKAHPESPDLDAQWDDYFSPKGRLSMDEFMAQQKTEQQKIQDELRAAVATDKGLFEQLKEQEKKRDQNDLDFDR